MADQAHIAVGRRKTSVARVRLLPGTGEIVVNRKPLETYFPRATLRNVVTRPLELTQSMDKYKVMANVNGGGISGQAGAIRHGIAHALISADPGLRPVLKKDGLLTRDSRMVERKKPGQKKARKRFQFSKR